MLRNECITKLINLEGAKFKDVDIQGDTIRILVTGEHEVQMCTKCSFPTALLVETKPKKYRDADLCNRTCYIEIDLRRFECRECGCTFNEPLLFAAPYRHYTKRFEEEVYKCCQETTAVYAGLKFGISDKVAAEIYYGIARQRQEKARPLLPVRVLGIDEIAMHKGHKDFVIVITDLTNKRVITILKERKKEALEQFLDGCTEEFKQKIQFVAIDLWGSYRSVVEAKLPKAKSVADRFHVMQNLNKALDTVRKREKRRSDDKEAWKNAKYTLLKNRENLTAEQTEVLAKVLQASASLKACYELKEAFRSVFNDSDDRETGTKKLYAWVLDVVRNEVKEYYAFIKTILNWETNILNYFDEWISSGFVEGVNNKIKLIKRKAFGFVNFENFKTKIVDCFA